MKNDNVLLRRIKEDDVPVLAKLANNRKIWDNVRDFFPYPYREKDAEFFYKLCEKEKPQVTFAIDFNGEFAGITGLTLQPDVHKISAEIGYWTGEPFWNKGIATTAVRLLTDYAFTNLKLIRLYCGIFDFNKASQKVIEKAGFTLEAVFKKSCIKNGKICDEYRYALIV